MNQINSTTKPDESVDIRDIVENRKLIAYCQQIVSISRKMVIGVEGLIRGIDTNSEELIQPKTLFEIAKKQGISVDLDRACRTNILEDFSKIYKDNPKKLLFLNLDVFALEEAFGSGYLLEQVTQNNIEPSNVVIEISEKDPVSSAMLKKFTDTYRQCGFKVALDDVGTGFSNMDRILLLKPDIIKIDISLVKNIHNDFYKQGVFKSLVILANKIGALVIAEGVETEEEAIQVLRLGGHMIQGFFFSKPFKLNEGNSAFVSSKIDELSRHYNEYMNLQYLHEKRKYNRQCRIAAASVKKLAKVSSDEFESILLEIVSDCENMECAYILDSSGIQISQTLFAKNARYNRENLIFYSATIGTDHSMEKYFYPLLNTKRKKYTTEPYISLASGNLCITISSVFFDTDNNKYILCSDFTTTEDSYNIELRGPVVGAMPEKDSEISGIISKMNEEINTDSLTGAFNRRYLNGHLATDISNSVGTSQPLSVILCDIDNFKEVNDSYGHLAGDLVLKELVQITKQCIKDSGAWVARYGGDEFVVVLVNTDLETAGSIANEIKCACEKVSIEHNEQIIGFTISAGVCGLPEKQMSIEELLEFADKNLYAAKKAGRNQVVNGVGLS